VQPTGCDFSEGEAMAHTRLSTGTTTRQRMTAAPHARRVRRRPRNQRFVLVLIAFAIVLLALGGWAVQALRLAR
jgi:cytochrome c-type biogenesis protein CcmH/NrfG